MTVLYAALSGFLAGFLWYAAATGKDGKAAVDAGLLVFCLLGFVHYQIEETRR